MQNITATNTEEVGLKFEISVSKVQTIALKRSSAKLSILIYHKRKYYNGKKASSIYNHDI